MASITNNNTMQYKPAEPMQASPSTAAAQENAHAGDCEAQQPKAPRTFLGMRGGGILLDMCACFICCECMDGCCHAIDDCCCC
ncbi:hypothetical protein B0A54_13131 [Friedmanniomyces endolithicus]|uniref:Uncharacterized protein n=1 Tax=Friedmanniomyces endolithicus TaxID=329885 RepID=A0A4U0UIZ4_9PEZI|nr:hypothetical protein B0A54_13131 [Friedmanniomyces endolithicus]